MVLASCIYYMLSIHLCMAAVFAAQLATILALLLMFV